MSDPECPPQPAPPGYFPDPTLNEPTVAIPAVPHQPGPSQTPQPGSGAPEARPPYTPGYPPPASYPAGPAQAPYPAGPAQAPYQPAYDPTAPQPYPAATSYGQQPGYPSYPNSNPSGSPYSYAYQQPKKSRTGLIVGIVAASLVVLAGLCVGGALLVANSAGKAKSSTAVGGGTGADNGGAPADGAKDHTGDLRTFLVKPPSSSHPLAKPMSKTGTMTLEDDVAQATDKQARRNFLQEYNFVIEAVVEWEQSDDTIVEVRLLRFDNADDAKGYFTEDKAKFTDDYGSGNMTPVKSAGNAVTFADSKKDKYGYVATAGIGVRGDVVIVTFTSQAPPLSVTVADNLMQEQYAKL